MSNKRPTYLRLEAFRVALDAMHIGIIVWDAKGQLVAISHEASILAGVDVHDPVLSQEEWSRSAVVCYPDGQPYPIKKTPFYRSFVERETISGARFSIKQTKSGKLIPVTINSMPLFDHDNFVGAVLIMQKIR